MPSFTLAFRAPPNPVYIATNPTVSIPGERAARIGVLPFKLIDESVRLDRFVVDRVAGQVRKGRSTIGVADRRYIGWCLLCLPGVLVDVLRQSAGAQDNTYQRQRDTPAMLEQPAALAHSSTLNSRNMPASMWNSR